jgi:hypothetical protein
MNTTTHYREESVTVGVWFEHDITLHKVLQVPLAAGDKAEYESELCSICNNRSNPLPCHSMMMCWDVVG